MKKTSEPIVFFGSGPVAAESLRRLERDFEIEAVVTKPKPEHHKATFPVLELANQLGLKSFTPRNRQELSELFASKPVSSKIGIVIDYGIIINKDVIDYFPLGIVNSHFSLLPEWRGADPITFSVLSGQKRTGISLMLINEKMDEGPLLAQVDFVLPVGITTPQLTHKLIDLSHSTLLKILPDYMAGIIRPVPQDSSIEPTYSRKLVKDDGLLDWSKPADVLEREVRAYSGWPRSRTSLKDMSVVITKAHAVDSSGPVGQTWVENKQLGVYCGSGSLVIDSLIPPGKKEMPATAFLAGYSLS